MRERLSGRQAIDRKRVEALSGEPAGIDLLESVAAKFSRMQDNLVDKLLPRLLIAAGERPRAAIDNLNRAERPARIFSPPFVASRFKGAA